MSASSPPSASGLPVPPDLQRGKHRDREAWIASGVFAVDLLSRTLGRDDLAGVDLLDVGCGTKIVKTLLDTGAPIGHYVGVDVFDEIIDFLNESVADPRFEFHHLDARNDLYNPAGTPLGEFAELPVGGRQFDLICLFSVFTHLAPDDYVAMLRLLRPHVKPVGQLLFSVHLDDPDHPSVFAMAVERQLASDDPAVAAKARIAVERAQAAKKLGFLDEIPEKPLLQARYDKDYALELFAGTGWEVVEIHPPERYIQHYMVCRPT